MSILALDGIDVAEQAEHGDPLAADRLGHERGVEPEAAARRDVEKLPLVLRDVRDPCLDEVLHGGWNWDGVMNEEQEPTFGYWSEDISGMIIWFKVILSWEDEPPNPGYINEPDMFQLLATVGSDRKVLLGLCVEKAANIIYN